MKIRDTPSVIRNKTKNRRSKTSFSRFTYHISPITQKGFSLFEILIVVVIFAVVVFIANQAFISSLKSGTKSDLQQKVKSNSNYIFSVMERSLHSSSSVTLCSPSIGTNPVNTQIQYKDTNNVSNSFTCVPGASGTFTSSVLGQLNSADVGVTSCSITCTRTNAVTEVNINLTLQQAGGSAGLRPDEQDAFQAQTKVTLRDN